MQNKRNIYAIIMLVITLILSFCVYKKNIAQHYRIYKDVQFDVSTDGTYSTDYLSLPAGTVRLVMCYAAASDCEVEIVKGLGISETHALTAGDGLYLEVFPEIPQSTDLFRLRIKDGTDHGFELYNYEIETVHPLNNDYTFTAILILLAGIALTVVYLKFYDKITMQGIITFAILTAFVLFTSYPLFRNYLVYGHDLWGHMTRVEGMKDAIRGGHIIPVIYPEHNNGYGTLGLVYPQLLLYPAALLRLANVSMVAVWNFELILINALTAVLTYFPLKSLCRDLEKKGLSCNWYFAAMLGTLVYMLNPYRLTNMYTREALGETIAMAFLPLFIVGIYHLFAGEPKKWYMLAVAATLVLHNHVLSVVMYAMVAALLGILMLSYAIKNRFAERVKYFGICIGTVVIGNIWYLIPFVRLYRSGLNLERVDHPNFYRHGTFLAQLFMTKSSDYVGLYESEGIVDEMSQSLGIIGAIALIFILLVILQSIVKADTKTDTFFKAVSVSVFIFILMSLTIFPWENLSDNPITSTVMRTIQYPTRFLGLAAGLMAVAVAVAACIKDDIFGYKREFAVLALVFGLIGCIPILDSAATRDIEVTDVTGGFAIQDFPEYRPAGTDIEIFKKTGADVTGSATVSDIVRSDAGMTFTVSADEGSQISVPLLYYPGYGASCNGTKLSIRKGEDNRIVVEVPAGTNGTVTVDYSYARLFAL